MKRILFCSLLFCLNTNSYSQGINLKKLVKDIYFNKVDPYNKHNITYVISPAIAFVINDTAFSEASYTLTFFNNEVDFKNRLKIVNDLERVHLSITAIHPEFMTARIGYFKTDYKAYTNKLGSVFSAIDERTIRLKYDAQTDQWIYDKTIEINYK